MNIYEEAKEELKQYYGYKGLLPKTIKALTYAQKEHKLLGLYREKIKGIENIAWGNDIQKQIRELEKELEKIK